MNMFTKVCFNYLKLQLSKFSTCSESYLHACFSQSRKLRSTHPRIGRTAVSYRWTGWIWEITGRSVSTWILIIRNGSWVSTRWQVHFYPCHSEQSWIVHNEQSWLVHFSDCNCIFSNNSPPGFYISTTIYILIFSSDSHYY